MLYMFKGDYTKQLYQPIYSCKKTAMSDYKNFKGHGMTLVPVKVVEIKRKKK